MLLNGKNFKIFDLDTEETKIQRVASILNTTPLFLKVIEQTDSNIRAINILDDLEIKISEGSIKSYTDFVSVYSSWLETKNDEEQLLFTKWFVIFFITEQQKIIKDIGLNFLLMNEFFNDAVGGRSFDVDFVEKTWSSRIALNRNFEKEVEENYTLVQNSLAYFEKFSSQNHIAIKSSDFIVETLKIYIKIISKVDIFSTFNSINITSTHFFEKGYLRLVVANLNNLYILNTEVENFTNATLIEEEKEDDKISILIEKMFTELKRSKEPEYLILTLEKIPLSDHIIITFDNSIATDDSGLLKDSLIEYVFSIFQNDIFKVDNIVDDNSKFKGSYVIPKQSFKKEIFLHQILNNMFFSQLYCDERIKASKQQNRLYLYFESLKTGKVKLSISNHVILNNNDPFMKPLKMEIGDSYVKVKIISISDENLIPCFKTQMDIIFSRYFLEEESLVNFYNLYIDLFKQDNKSTKKQKNQLMVAVPELFLPLYSRKCAMFPKIVDTESTGEFQTMKYPIYNEGGLEPKIYSCAHYPTHPYPGLRKNNLENSDIFHYLPCCYATNQEDRNGSSYRNYFYNERIKKDMTDHELYKTGRLVPINIRGILPRPINQLFQVIDKDVSYLRYGVTRSPNSFLECVLFALGKSESFKKIRNELSNDNYIGFGRQETFDVPIEDLKKWLQSNDYFDPKRFIRMVERYFNTSIILFERNIGECNFRYNYNNNTSSISFKIEKTSNDGYISLRNHAGIGPYMTSKLRKRTILIYTHFGSGEILKIAHPQSELIVSEDNNFIWDSSSDLIQNLEKIYLAMVNAGENYQTPNTSFDLNLYKSQMVDSTGKTKFLVTKDNKTIDVGYIAPLFLPLQNITMDYSELKKFVITKNIAKVLFFITIHQYILLSDKISFTEFKESFTTVVNDYDYKLPTFASIPYYKIFEPFFLIKNKVVFSSESLRTRVLYNAKLLIDRKFTNVKYMFNTDIMTMYFQTASDFSQNVIFGENTFLSIIENNKDGQVIKNTLTTIEHSVFIKNTSIENNKLMYAKPYSNLEDAIKHLPNPTKNIKLFVYDNNNGFEEYFVGSDPPYSNKMLIFKNINGYNYLNLYDL